MIHILRRFYFWLHYCELEPSDGCICEARVAAVYKGYNLVSRRPGISTLISCQNEEATVGWCILSFLDFSDEIIVVDNGSNDRTKDIVREIARKYPERIQFFDRPHLRDLYESRQCALEHSTCRWIMRADADYVCYTSGEYNAIKLREHVLNRKDLPWPVVYRVCRPNLFLDYWHTGRFESKVTSDDRIYRHFPGFRFGRLGRWEGVQFGRISRRLRKTIDWKTPVLMHCDIKSDINFLYRSQRTNWRELGDFDKYPTLSRYLDDVVLSHQGAASLQATARVYVEKNLIPLAQPYDQVNAFPYPDLVQKAMRDDPVYRIEADGSTVRRRYLGVTGAACHL